MALIVFVFCNICYKYICLGGNKYKACFDSTYTGKSKRFMFNNYIKLRCVTRHLVGPTREYQWKPPFPTTEQVRWCAGCCRWPSDGSWCSPLARTASSRWMVSDMRHLNPILCTYSLNAEQFVSAKWVGNNSQRSFRYVPIISVPASVLWIENISFKV